MRRRKVTRVLRVYRGYCETVLRLSDGRKVTVPTINPRNVPDCVRTHWEPMLGPYARYPYIEDISPVMRRTIQHAMARHPKCR